MWFNIDINVLADKALDGCRQFNHYNAMGDASRTQYYSGYINGIIAIIQMYDYCAYAIRDNAGHYVGINLPTVGKQFSI